MRTSYALRSSSLPDESRLVAFRAHEALSRPYRVDLWVVAPDEGAHELAESIGGKVTLTIDLQDGRDPFHFAGVIGSLRRLNQMPGAGLYHVVVVPRLHLLEQSRHSRIFTRMNVPDVLEAVLKEGGLTSSDYELRLTGSYPVEEHICQYQESDLDFFHRWMEHEGIFYFFEHQESGETLVIADAKAVHAALPKSAIPYSPGFGDDESAGECFSLFSCEQVALPASVVLTDRDYLHPALEVKGTAKVSRTGTGDVVSHNARFFTPDAGARYAKIRAEELLARQTTYEASGTALYLRAGYLFSLADHPRTAFNTSYLATEVFHEGDVDGWSPEPGPSKRDPYRVRVHAIGADVQFRPRRLTAWPHAHGLEGATIDGPAVSEYAQIDEHGRYAVKTFFDEGDLKDGKASTYLRMAQPHGGDVEGFHFPLRKGTEVMLLFLGGDPDRPLVASVAPNALKPSPVTSKNHTSNVIQTGGRNRMEFEDQAGSQRVTVFSPTKNTFLRMGAPNDDVNAYLSTDGNGKIEVGGAVSAPLMLTVTTVKAKDEHVTGTVTEQFHGPFSTTVTNDTTEVYQHDKTEKVHDALEEIYQNDLVMTVVDKLTEKYQSLDTTIKDERSEYCAADVKQEYKGPLSTTVALAASEHFKDTFKLGVTGEHTHTVTGPINRTILGNLVHEDKNGFEMKVEGAKGKMTLGAVTETFVGFKIEVIFGAKAETTVGLKMENVGLGLGFHTFNEFGGPAEIAKEGSKIEFEPGKAKAIAGPMLKVANFLNSHKGGFLFRN